MHEGKSLAAVPAKELAELLTRYPSSSHHTAQQQGKTKD